MTPSPASRRRFAILLFSVIGLYGLFAAVLSWQVIQAQGSVRNNLSIALNSMDFLHQRQMDLENDPAVRNELQSAWAEHRALWVGSDAQRWALAFLGEWNKAAVAPACGAKAPAFVLGKAPENRQERACHVYVAVVDGRIQVTGYDTQGAAMDNFYESLYPFHVDGNPTR
ncbi:hypothetical protein HFU84_11135 [Acidithiobacillus sp. CV18-2]|uniref:Uncharacterized protein n=1 Tax=Igneacidithiobacillus copahuensis TaxID=2724909 RepID=A0AAE3CIG8_9PROT|nr:hypothetical protein [Igneacidithiobacillus copahuensis]MBU2753710.1 hypothetical protein [Acidithiobacillus sp. CV18-3]MBU2758298.1 hypothetical protein [Acidithiobacillus sp. BN09-2]MBU2778049.1 hypothetical protein [Acidithiobacillus sp. CV18-2]MBU2796061.1 hypothetical protein [Acidithiobacillus sp. VAN18-2]MBU2798016.1 hypothetical protein [Acidithiobacillus sp. VAN18-4]UTV80332.1 hypothetical protein MQE22_09920 [Acidithiobacillus sp. YTS05]